jgi:hypothetical protein
VTKRALDRMPDLPDPYSPEPGECCYHAHRVNASVDGFGCPTTVWRCCFCRHEQPATSPPDGHGPHFPVEKMVAAPPVPRECEKRQPKPPPTASGGEKWPARRPTTIGDHARMRQREREEAADRRRG